MHFGMISGGFLVMNICFMIKNYDEGNHKAACFSSFGVGWCAFWLFLVLN